MHASLKREGDQFIVPIDLPVNGELDYLCFISGA